MAKERSGIKAVFFDLDDTLCAYWKASKTGLREAFLKHGPPDITPERMMESWAETFREFSPTLKQTGWYEGYCVSGEPTRTEQMRLTLEHLGIDDEAMAAKLSESYRFERNRALKLFPGTEEVLATLHRQYKLGLITNGPADIQREEIETLGVERFFDEILIEGEMGEGKPLASVFERAAASVPATGDELLFVGNSYRHDVRPALDAGWHAIWVRRESDVPPSAASERSRPEEMPEGAPQPDAVVRDLGEVISYVSAIPQRGMVHSQR